MVSTFPTIDSIKINNCEYAVEFGSLNGNVLFTPEASTYTYLIDMDGEIVNLWESNYIQGLAVYLLSNGDVVRSDLSYLNPIFICGGVTGCIERFSWDGSLLWRFDYSNDQYCLHHDIEPLPNGNILMVGWEYKGVEETIEAGRNPSTMPAGKFFPDHIIEVKQTGPTSGDIVWEWHVWDHLIQDFNPTKDNYGVVADHPELLDINFGQSPVFGDWNHINSIDYNEEFDQILLSSLGFDEIWIIDHSTTTQEAASHTGGNSGKGGDILYRWGNPISYRAGTISDQKLFNQHDARWIEKNYPGETNILVFNNGQGRPIVEYSSVDEFTPPVDNNGNYYLEPGSQYGPEDLIWSYTADNPTDFYAYYLSSAQRLKDGNTIICDGPAGRFFEVTPEKNVVWEYINNYPNPVQNNVFKIQFIPIEESPNGSDLDCDGSLYWTDVKGGYTINGSFILRNIGDPGSSLVWRIDSFPDWGTWLFDPQSGDSLTPEDGQITVQVSVVAPDIKDREFTGVIRIQNLDNFLDFEDITIYLKTPKNSINIFSFFFLENYQYLLKMFKNYFTD